MDTKTYSFLLKLIPFTFLVIIISFLTTEYFLSDNFLASGQLQTFDSVRSNESKQDDNKKLSDFTLFIYMIGSNLEDQSFEASKDIKEMLNASSFNPRVNIVLETGGSEKKLNDNNPGVLDFSTVKRHIIYNRTIQTIEKPELGVLNMGDNKTLYDFINWGLNKFPAKKYGLILWDHGGSYGGFGKDMNFGKANINQERGDGLTMYELQSALSLSNINNKSSDHEFEFIGFDACLMASIEVADRIVKADMTDNKTNIKYLVASEEIEPNWGWNYTSILDIIYKRPDITGDVVGNKIVKSYEEESKNISEKNNFYAYRDITLSVIDLTKIKAIREKLSGLSFAWMNGLENSDSVSKLLHTIDVTEHYGITPRNSLGIIDL